MSGGVEGPEEGQGVVVVAAAPAIAGDLVYQPVNPSFGGNPGNSGHLLSIANAQRRATA
ncbi:MAG: hypothetical protein H5U20_03415, partial [Rhodobacteraceae bacterium]|nr:hypothetical protein [Paracoccaceae bacterium]